MSVPNASSPPGPPPSLVERYCPEQLSCFTAQERARFLGGIDPLDLERPDAWPAICATVAWELLYRVEPGLYERLVAGETLHPGIFRWLPPKVGRAVEVGAGAGRLTVPLARRCDELIAVEPARPLRERLAGRLAADALGHVETVAGFFDELPVADRWADLVISCSAFTPDPAHGGEAGLAELERVAAPAGLVVFVWPADAGWLAERGYVCETFGGPMAVEFASLDEAVELAEIFYPHAVDEILRRGSPTVSYEILGMNPPRDLAWKRLPA